KSDTGATVFEVIEQAARVRGVLLTSDFFGNLVITRASNAKPVAKLQLGYNIERASREGNGRNRFRSYRLMGQQQGSDYLSPDQSAQVLAGPMEDPGVTRHRPFIITPEWPLDTKAAE